MNIIDISHWQSGLNLATVFSQNPTLDGVIVKATGGVSFVDYSCDGWVQWLIANNKPWGFYHFLDDDFKNYNGKAEAEFFVKNTKNYFGKGFPFADYEYPATYKGTAYLKQFLDRVYELTGVKCGVYCSLNTVQTQDFSAIAAAGYPLWLAQYPDNNIVNGFIENPWQRGSYAPFDKYWLHQYTSHGRLNGWRSNLDFDKFYGTIEDWNNFVGNSAPAPTPAKKPADPAIVLAVLNDEYGSGANRAAKLEKAGYDAQSVQTKINELYNIAQYCRGYVRGNEDYFSAIEKIIKSL